MKKIIFILILFVFSISITNAATCVVVNGSGTNVGDEIQCGTESFYLLSNNGKETKMLSKYNLMVGITLYKIEFEQTFESYSLARNYYHENYSDEYEGLINLTINDDDLYNGAIAYNVIEYNQVLQNSEALGAHGDKKGNPEFPEIGITMWEAGIEADIESAFTNGEENYGGGNFIDFQLINDSSNLVYINEYRNSLKEMDIDVTDISLLTVSDINDIIYQLTGEEMPLEEWDKNAQLINTNEGKQYYVLGNLKKLLPEEYSWLWSTTYWTNTSTAEQKANGTGKRYFIDTLGYLCSEYSCGEAVGAGVRPVVTVSSDFIYKIETKTDGGGSINVIDNAKLGDEVTFDIVSEDGYKLKEIKVLDANNNVVLLTNNTFIMPASTVIIEVEFEQEITNPNTFSLSIIVCVLVALISFIIVKLYNKKLIWMCD